LEHFRIGIFKSEVMMWIQNIVTFNVKRAFGLKFEQK
jgi:uncharacterized protein YktB (UPF0637 family)